LATTPWPGVQNDLITVRAIMRGGFGWPYERAVVQITGTLPPVPGG
jgi:hypothetical protein